MKTRRPVSVPWRAFASAGVALALLVAAPRPGDAADKYHRRPSKYTVHTANALNSGAFLIEASLGAPFLTLGATVGVANRLNIGLAWRSVYLLLNGPELNLKGTIYEWREDALALTFDAGALLGGVAPRYIDNDYDGEYTDGVDSRTVLSRLPGFIDDARHMRLVPGFLYSHAGDIGQFFFLASCLTQVFFEDELDGTPRKNASLLPSLTAGIEFEGISTQMNFYLQAMVGAYIDRNVVDLAADGCNPADLTSCLTTKASIAGGIQFGIALHLF